MERKLSRGLDALLGKGGMQQAAAQSVQTIPVDLVRPNPRQPRREFAEDALQSLRESIARDGLLQPIVVRRVSQGYELIAGERRWRACRALQMQRIPAVVRTVEQDQQLVLALVENLQRTDLNPIDEARAFRQLRHDFGLTHEEVARRVGRERSTVTNALRLLELPASVLAEVSRGTLSAGHARALLPLVGHAEFQTVVDQVVADGWSVRQTERGVRDRMGQPSEPMDAPATGSASTSTAAPIPHRDAALVQDLEERLRDRWGVMVELRLRRRGADVRFRCASREELNDLLDRLLSAGAPPDMLRSADHLQEEQIDLSEDAFADPNVVPEDPVSGELAAQDP